jgi:hypothetical protein
MKSLLGLGSGGAFTSFWEKLPALVRYPVIFGLGIYSAAELGIDFNHALNAPQIFGGQAAQGDAQIANPLKTRDDMKAGLPVTGAAALVATQVGVGNADALQKGAIATAASESVEDIRAKIAKGQKPTTSEVLALREVEIKEAELRTKTAEAKIKEAESSAAAAKANSEIALSKIITGIPGTPGGSIADWENRAISNAIDENFGLVRRRK